jgi:hypothetical protein
MASGVTWEGEPIFYRRKKGFGLIIRDLHYLFDASGRIEAVSGINDKLLEFVLSRVQKDKDPKMMVLAQAVGRGRQKARLETRKRHIGKTGRGMQ